MRTTWFHTIVETREAVLQYRDGRLDRVLEAGRHPRMRRATLMPVDLAERLTMMAPQDIPAADGVQVKVSAAVRWDVVDPVAFVERTRQPDDVVYLAAQVALRSALAELTVEELNAAIRTGGELAERLRAEVDAAAAEVGVRVLAVVVRDVILPAEVRSANVELATARVRGQAQLEAARAETAALRSLANAAKLLDASPALTQLRLVQSAPLGTQVRLQLGAPPPSGAE